MRKYLKKILTTGTLFVGTSLLTTSLISPHKILLNSTNNLNQTTGPGINIISKNFVFNQESNNKIFTYTKNIFCTAYTMTPVVLDEKGNKISDVKFTFPKTEIIDNVVYWTETAKVTSAATYLNCHFELWYASQYPSKKCLYSSKDEGILFNINKKQEQTYSFNLVDLQPITTLKLRSNKEIDLSLISLKIINKNDETVPNWKVNTINSGSNELIIQTTQNKYSATNLVNYLSNVKVALVIDNAIVKTSSLLTIYDFTFLNFNLFENKSNGNLIVNFAEIEFGCSYSNENVNVRLNNHGTINGTDAIDFSISGEGSSKRVSLIYKGTNEYKTTVSLDVVNKNDEKIIFSTEKINLFFNQNDAVSSLNNDLKNDIVINTFSNNVKIGDCQTFTTFDFGYIMLPEFVEIKDIESNIYEFESGKLVNDYVEINITRIIGSKAIFNFKILKNFNNLKNNHFYMSIQTNKLKYKMESFSNLFVFDFDSIYAPESEGIAAYSVLNDEIKKVDSNYIFENAFEVYLTSNFAGKTPYENFDFTLLNEKGKETSNYKINSIKPFVSGINNPIGYIFDISTKQSNEIFEKIYLQVKSKTNPNNFVKSEKKFFSPNNENLKINNFSCSNNDVIPKMADITFGDDIDPEWDFVEIKIVDSFTLNENLNWKASLQGSGKWQYLNLSPTKKDYLLNDNVMIQILLNDKIWVESLPINISTYCEKITFSDPKKAYANEDTFAVGYIGTRVNIQFDIESTKNWVYDSSTTFKVFDKYNFEIPELYTTVQEHNGRYSVYVSSRRNAMKQYYEIKIVASNSEKIIGESKVQKIEVVNNIIKPAIKISDKIDMSYTRKEVKSAWYGKEKNYYIDKVTLKNFLISSKVLQTGISETDILKPIKIVSSNTGIEISKGIALDDYNTLLDVTYSWTSVQTTITSWSTGYNPKGKMVCYINFEQVIIVNAIEQLERDGAKFIFAESSQLIYKVHGNYISDHVGRSESLKDNEYKLKISDILIQY